MPISLLLCLFVSRPLEWIVRRRRLQETEPVFLPEDRRRPCMYLSESRDAKRYESEINPIQLRLSPIVL